MKTVIICHILLYNIWKKGMGNEGIDYIKGKVAQ